MPWPRQPKKWQPQPAVHSLGLQRFWWKPAWVAALRGVGFKGLGQGQEDGALTDEAHQVCPVLRQSRCFWRLSVWGFVCHPGA